MKPLKKTGVLSRLWLGSLGLIAILLMPLMALAGDPAATGIATSPAQTGLESFSAQVMAILVPVFVTFIGALATLLLNKAKAKLHLDVSDKTAEQWQNLAKAAALRGAEWARKKAKELTDGKKVPGPDVLDVAVLWATDMAVAQGLPELARNKLEGLIESELFKLRHDDESMAKQVGMSGGVTVDLGKLSKV